MDTQTAPTGTLRVFLFSFGFKYGLPEEVNFLWDVRFLPNPYWVESLRERTGKEKDVSQHAIGNALGEEFLKLVEPLICFLIEKNTLVQKDAMHLAIGCTGGRHRSVAVVESLRKVLDKLPVELTVYHRDIEKG